MKVVRSLDGVERPREGRAVAVGTFDGVHLGHRAVIGSALGWAREHGARATVVTFDPHPLAVLRPDEPPQLLTPIAVKEDLIEDLGVDELVVIPFTDDFLRIEADEFSRDVLAGTLDARFVSVGENFRFGHEAAGDAALLRERPEFETEVVSLLERNGGPVSSSRIRKLVEAGDVTEAGELLGAPLQLEGVVVEGDARGRSLGMPTANLSVAPGLVLPASGVYAGRALDHPAAVNIGVRPTFVDDGELLIEANLLDFEGDLYGQTIRLTILERLRDELKFDSADELVRQMEQDVQQVRAIAGD